MYIIPSRVEELHTCVFDGVQTCPELTVDAARAHLHGMRAPFRPRGGPHPLTHSLTHSLTGAEELSKVREDHLRVLNPTPYKVSVTEKLYEFMMELIDANAPLNVLS